MRSLLLVLIITLCTLTLAGQASAHAALVTAVPAQGAVLAETPATFELAFNEAVSPLLISLVSPGGKAVELADATLVGTTVRIGAPDAMAPGTYVLNYRVISADGHPVGGAVSWSIGAPGGSASIASADGDPTLLVAIWAAKLVIYLGLFIGVGSAFFQAWLSSPGDSRWITAALLAALVAAPVSIGLQGADALGLTWPSLLGARVWITGLETSLGPSAALCLLAIIAAIAGKVVPRRRLLAVAAMLALGLSFAATGHASDADPHWLTRSAVFIHAITIAFWVGALLPLWAALRLDGAAAASALRGFSRLIPWVLIALVATGSTLAVIQLGSLAALLTTPYGRIFGLKMALVSVLFLLAAYNRWRLTPAVESRSDTSKARGVLRAIILSEIALLICVMGVVGLWRFTPPPRTMAPLVTTPLSMHIHTSQAMAQITLATATAGPNTATIYLMDGQFGPLSAQALDLVASSPALGINAIKYKATLQSDGYWRVDGMTLPVAGVWTIQLDIRASEFEMIKIEDQLTMQ